MSHTSQITSPCMREHGEGMGWNFLSVMKVKISAPLGDRRCLWVMCSGDMQLRYQKSRSGERVLSLCTVALSHHCHG